VQQHFKRKHSFQGRPNQDGKSRKFQRVDGVCQAPPGMEIPEVGWGSKVKVPSVGGAGGGWILSGLHIWKFWFFRRGENRSTQRETSRSKGEDQQQTQRTYSVAAGIWTRVTLVGASALTAAPSLVLKSSYSKTLAKHWVQRFCFGFIYSPL